MARQEVWTSSLPRGRDRIRKDATIKTNKKETLNAPSSGDAAQTAERRRRPPPGGTFGDFEAGGGTRLRHGFWVPAGQAVRGRRVRGSVVLLTGRREFIEKYFETIADLLERQFAVFTMDWRGQGLSQRLLANRHKGHVGSFDDYVDDLAGFIEGVVTPRAERPLILLAHSMGGHMALRYLRDHPGAVAGAVLTAPMVDIHWGGLPDGLMRAISALASTAGANDSYALGQHDFDDRDRRFAGNRLSSDPDRFADEGALVDADPALALGGVTFGWLRAALASIEVLKAPGFAAAIATPVLIAEAGADRVVSNTALRAMARALPDCRRIEIPGARHEILKERDPLRAQFWAAFDRFLDDIAPG